MSLTPSGAPDTFWHVIPLHYVPYLLHTGALYAQTQFAARKLPLIPRATATRRDRKLGLDKYVHFSFTPQTPLLAHKQKKGYPHVLLEWNVQIADLPSTAFSRYNAKVLVTVKGTIRFIVSPQSPSRSGFPEVVREVVCAAP